MSRAKRSYEETLCDDAHMMGSPHRGPAVAPSASPCAQQHAAAASSSSAAAAFPAASSQHAPSQQQQPQSTASLFRMHRLAPAAASTPDASAAAASSLTGFESRSHAPAPSLFSLADNAAMQSPTRAFGSAVAAASSSSSSSSAAHTPFFSSPSVAAATSAASTSASGSLLLSSSKRSRRAGAADVSAMCDESSAQQSPTAASSSSSSSLHGAADEAEETAAANGTIHASPFAKLKRVHVDEVIQVPRSYKKQAIAAALAGPSSMHHGPIAASPHIPAPPSSNPQSAGLASYHHQLFTYDQVASIVRNAVEMRESQIRAEYDATLARLLAEQFESFSNFNKDYISRSMQRASDDHENSIYS